MVQTYSEIFKRDLLVLRKEVSLYQVESHIWEILDGTTNSAGNLCLHLLGNLYHFVGKGLGDEKYQRNRDLEFTSKPISKEQLLNSIDDCKSMIDLSFNGLEDEMLLKPFSLPWRKGEFFDTHFMLTQLVLHFSYHLGQINYHRRYFSKEQ